MKKTLLIIAVAAMSTSLAFGQTKVVINGSPQREAENNLFKREVAAPVSNRVLPLNAEISKKTFTKAGDPDSIRTWTISRADFETFNFGYILTGVNAHTMSGNTGNWVWYSRATAQNCVTEDRTSHQFVNISKPNTYNRWGTYINNNYTEIRDGALLMTHENIGEGGYVFNTYVEFPEIDLSAYTDPILLEFSQFAARFYREVSYIDFSVDGGTTWSDTVYVNSLSDTYLYGDGLDEMVKIAFPKAASGSARVKFRIHQLMRQGDVWFIGEVRVKKAKDKDLVIGNQVFVNNFYSKIPQGLKIPSLAWAATGVRNVGAKDLNNVQAVVSLYKNGNLIDSTTSSPITIVSGNFPDTVIAVNEKWTDFHGERTVIVPTDEIANYTISEKIKYTYEQGGTQAGVYTFDHRGLKMNVNYDNTKKKAIWSRDNGVFSGGIIWTGGITQDLDSKRYDVEQPYWDVNERNYGVALGYDTHETEFTAEDLYIVGVQMLLDSLSTLPGETVAQPMVGYIEERTDTTIIINFRQGDYKMVCREHILNLNPYYYYDEDTDADMRYFEMPIEPILIDTNQTYYAGYRTPGGGKLGVLKNYPIPAKDLDNRYAFKSGRQRLVMFTSEENFHFGMWYYAHNTPMIRLIVSKDPNYSGFDNITCEKGIADPKGVDFKLNAFPNPAVDYINIIYKLETSSAATIEIRDIVGRLVKVKKSQAAAGEVKEERISTADLKPGTYVYTLNVNGLKQSKKFIIAQ